MSLPVYIIGGGGHASVVLDVLELMSREIAGIIDPLGQTAPAAQSGFPIFETDDFLLNTDPSRLALAIGIGGTGNSQLRQYCFDRYVALGFQVIQVIHPSATISSHSEIQSGVQIMAGAIIQPGCLIGRNSIINTQASVDHGCRIGANVHIAPGVVLSGDVIVGDGSHIGTGAMITQAKEIGANSVIGAGAVVLSDIPSGVSAWGVPAIVIKENPTFEHSLRG